jgi:4-diphosphocytidyl-2-C-methyl-D-erythritol kinase
MQDGGWPAPAKLNLFLHVTGRRADGYHEIQTLFQFLDLADRLRFEVRDDGRVRRLTNPELPEEDLTVRAAHLLKAETSVREGVNIHIDKRIPEGAGLGGGSSDAATTLIVLNALWRTRLSRKAMMRLALRLGSDVPVFVFGHAAWAEGVGEKLVEQNPRECWYCVIQPPVRAPTAAIFQDPELTRNTPVIKIRDFLADRARNDLELVARRRFPMIGEAIDWLARFGEARMTGSGSAVFTAVPDRTAGRRIIAQLPHGYRGFVTRGVNRHPLSSLEIPCG